MASPLLRDQALHTERRLPWRCRGRFAPATTGRRIASTDCLALRAAQPADQPDITRPKLHFVRLLDRGRIEVQRISELIKLRDQFVHPKVKAKPFNDLCRDGQGNFVGTPVSELFDGLKIEKGGPWSKEDAVTVLKAVFAFLNYYFIDLICFSHKKVFSLLVAAFEDIDDQEVSLEPAFHEWKNFLSEWNIPWRFLNDSRP